jgi:hypothetical protein
MTRPRRFRDPRKDAAYEAARTMHDALMVEQSGRGNAYRRGYQSPEQGWDRTWTSYPVWAAGVDNRRAHDSAHLGREDA